MILFEVLLTSYSRFLYNSYRFSWNSYVWNPSQRAPFGSKMWKKSQKKKFFLSRFTILSKTKKFRRITSGNQKHDLRIRKRLKTRFPQGRVHVQKQELLLTSNSCNLMKIQKNHQNGSKWVLTHSMLRYMTSKHFFWLVPMGSDILWCFLTDLQPFFTYIFHRFSWYLDVWNPS